MSGANNRVLGVVLILKLFIISSVTVAKEVRGLILGLSLHECHLLITSGQLLIVDNRIIGIVFTLELKVINPVAVTEEIGWLIELNSGMLLAKSDLAILGELDGLILSDLLNFKCSC